MNRDAEKHLRAAAREVFDDFLDTMQVLRPDGGSRALSVIISVTGEDHGYADKIHLSIAEDLGDGRVIQHLTAHLKT